MATRGRLFLKLQALAAQGQPAALWYLAGWYYGQSRYEEALTHLQTLAEGDAERYRNGPHRRC